MLSFVSMSDMTEPKKCVINSALKNRTPKTWVGTPYEETGLFSFPVVLRSFISAVPGGSLYANGDSAEAIT